MNYSYNQLNVSEPAHQGDPDGLQELALDGKYLVDRGDERDTPSTNGDQATSKAWLAAQYYSSDVEELNFE
jgi:hypothetical protein